MEPLVGVVWPPNRILQYQRAYVNARSDSQSGGQTAREYERQLRLLGHECEFQSGWLAVVPCPWCDAPIEAHVSNLGNDGKNPFPCERCVQFPKLQGRVLQIQDELKASVEPGPAWKLAQRQLDALAKELEAELET